MTILTLSSGPTTRSIALVPTTDDVPKVTIGTTSVEITSNSALAGPVPRLKLLKNGTTYRIKERYVTPSGRTLRRHPSDKATIITWFNHKRNQEESFAVLDAQYRSNKAWGNINTGLTAYTNLNVNGDIFLDGVSGNMTVENNRWPCTMTDQALYNLWSLSFDARTAKQNTNVLANNTLGKAAAYCRTQTLGDSACDLPTNQQLMVIAIEADQLDALDPTVASNPNYAFGEANSSGYMYGNFYYWWSSTYGGFAFGEAEARVVGREGMCATAPSSALYSVAPILEL